MGAGGAIGRGGAGQVFAFTEFGVGEGVIGELERERQVALQSSIEGICDDAGRHEAEVVEIVLLW